MGKKKVYLKTHTELKNAIAATIAQRLSISFVISVNGQQIVSTPYSTHILV